MLTILNILISVYEKISQTFETIYTLKGQFFKSQKKRVKNGTFPWVLRYSVTYFKSIRLSLKIKCFNEGVIFIKSIKLKF